MSMKLGIPYSMVSTVIEFEQDRRIAWQTRPPGHIPGKLAGGRIWRYELEPVEGGTRVRESWDISQEVVKVLVKPARKKTSRRCPTPSSASRRCWRLSRPDRSSSSAPVGRYGAAVTPSSAYPTGRSLVRLSKPAALGVVAGCYALAAVAAAITVVAWRGHHPIAVALFADLVATVVIFALSMVVANSSLYDAYWSVVPPVVAIGWAIAAPAGLPTGAQVRQVIVILLVATWSVRLTMNWASGWTGFDHEDWRYVGLREGLPRRFLWPFVSFAGVQLMPTLVVFAGMLPLWPALGAPRHGFGFLDVVATIVTTAAIALETKADLQLHAFTSDPANRGKPMDQGWWAVSRHPNYLGEITFWWGLWLFALAAAPSWWWTVVGPLAIVLLFETASIPMMEKRSLERRPEYAAYQSRVARLLPLRGRANRAGAVELSEPALGAAAGAAETGSLRAWPRAGP